MLNAGTPLDQAHWLHPDWSTRLKAFQLQAQTPSDLAIQVGLGSCGYNATVLSVLGDLLSQRFATSARLHGAEWRTGQGPSEDNVPHLQLRLAANPTQRMYTVTQRPYATMRPGQSPPALFASA